MKTAQPQKRKRPLTDAYLNSLPLWKLLSIAMVDLRKQERAKNSRVDMGEWLSQNGKCAACAAGSVLRWSRCIDAGAYEDSELSNDEAAIWHTTYRWRHAIDLLRSGRASGAATRLGRNGFSVCGFDRTITSYHSNSDDFWCDITKLRDDLKKAGV